MQSVYVHTGSADQLIFNSWILSAVKYVDVMDGEAISVAGEEYVVPLRL
jgi:hypothetical protein